MIVSLAFLVAVLLAVGLLSFLAKRQAAPSGPWPYYPKKPLSAVEQILYFRLAKALPGNIVLAQVGLSRVLGVKKGSNSVAWFNRISQMSVDFVICAKDSSIICAIELDDATHKRERRQEADAKKDKALADAGIRIFRVQANALPDEGALRSLVESVPVSSSV